MTGEDTLERLRGLFARRYEGRPAVAAFAPGRVEVLGNHTDYNEGFVLSAAIDMGTFFLARLRDDARCRVCAANLEREAEFTVGSVAPSTASPWCNYVKGVFAGLTARRAAGAGFDAVFGGTVPLGSGLSSSAALEISAGLALAGLYGVSIDKLDLARIGQAAEHDYAGVKCGLLDQVTSLFGREGHLVMTDFRSLEVRTVPLGDGACFLMCNTRAKHALVDGAYNERRERCRQAADYFAGRLDHPVRALRDVSWSEFSAHSAGMDPVAARRAAHVVGENDRVLRGRALLEKGDLAGFGELMFQSHESSIGNFENSCRELDAVVAAARRVPGVMGARLSGGGFGGSAVVLVHPRDAETVTHALAAAYRREVGHACEIRPLTPADGARLL